MAGRLRSPLCHGGGASSGARSPPPARLASRLDYGERVLPCLDCGAYMRTARGGVFSAYMCDWKEKRGGQCARPTPPSVFVVTCDQHCLRCAKEDRGRRMNMSRRGL